MKSAVVLSMMKVRRSKVHGSGVFAASDIKNGTRISEYVGDRISHAEADRRYADKTDDDNHTFLFTVDRRTVIDGGVGGNDARYINHSCDPNCETVIDGRRVYIEAIRDIRKGEELGYDYLIERDESDPDNVDQIWACRCGAKVCRGTMLLPHKPKKVSVRTKSAKKTKKKVSKSPAKKAKKTVKKTVKKTARKVPIRNNPVERSVRTRSTAGRTARSS